MLRPGEMEGRRFHEGAKPREGEPSLPNTAFIGLYDGTCRKELLWPAGFNVDKQYPKVLGIVLSEPRFALCGVCSICGEAAYHLFGGLIYIYAYICVYTF